MLIGARNGMLVKGAISAKSYIQDGLVGLWCSTETSGWGQFDPNATSLVDLKGNFPSLDISYIQGNLAVVDRNITPYQKAETVTTSWSTGHPYTHEILYRTDNYVTYDYIPHCVYESYPYRQNDYLMWATMIERQGGMNKLWVRTFGYSPSAQTGPLHTISMSNAANGISGAKMYLNATRLTTDQGYQADQTPRHRVSLALTTILYKTFYGCVRFYERNISEEELAHNRMVDEILFPPAT